MARYTSRNLNDNDNSFSKRRKWGIVLLLVSIFLFVCVITSFISPIRSVALGVFGLCLYPVLLAFCVISVLMMIEKKYVISKGYIFTLIGLFLAVVCLFQLIFAYPQGGFSDYVLNCYHSKNTAGGLLMGSVAFAISAVLGSVGSYAIVGLAVIVCVAFIIDHFLKMSEYNEVTNRIVESDVKKIRGDESSILQGSKSVKKRFNEQTKKQTYAKRPDKQFDDDEDDIVESEIEDEQDDADGFRKPTGIINDDFELSDDKEDEVDHAKRASTYKEKLAILQSKTSAAARGNDAALNIWGQEFIDSLGKKEEKPKNDAVKKDYNINDLFMDRRKQTRDAFVSNDNSSKPAMFVHEDDNTEELFASKLAEHDNQMNNNRFNQQNNQNQFNRNNQFNNQNQFNNRNNQQNNVQNADQRNNRMTPNVNVARFNQNSTPQNPIFVEDDDDDIDEIFDAELKKDDASDIIGPTNRQDRALPNLNQMRGSRFDGNAGFSQNNDRSQNNRMQPNMSQNNRMQQNANQQPQQRVPEQIKIRQTQPTDQPTTKYRRPSPYVKPPIELLKVESAKTSGAEEEYSEKAARLEETLEDFKIPAKVVGITHGPAVTRYELQMPAGIPVKNIARHSDDIAMKLESFHGVRIEAPIPGRNLVGVEVPNGKVATIGLKDIIGSKEFLENKAPLTFALGKDISGAIKVCDLGAMPHLLVAGSTGSGKSVCLNVFLLSLLYRLGPDDLKLILIDPKRVEFVTYNYLPHMLIPKAINESQQALNALDWAIKEMTRRYDLFSQKFVRNFKEYNSLQSVYDGVDQKLPYIVIVVDEVADLMMNNKREMEDKIKRLTQLARAAGIHLVLATQRPSVDIITGTIKSNLPSRIAFAVTNYMDSKTILDQGGAENLLGKGDMLYAPQDASEPMRIQCPYVDSNEVYAITEFIKKNNEAEFDDNLCDEVLNGDKKANQPEGDALGNNATSGPEFDPILPEALLEFIEDGGEASISLIQRRHSVGYGRAARIIDQMEKMGYVSKKEGNNRRNVLISREQYDEIFGTDN